MVNRQVIFASYADGTPKAADFAFAKGAVAACEAGHVVVRNHFLSVDPAQKGWMSRAANYASAKLGEPMKALAVGEVVASALEDLAVGEFVTGWFGWQEYAHVPRSAIQRKVDPASAPLSYAVGALGLNGLTAYLVLTDILQPVRGETVLVSTAAGAVGSVVGQLAKRRGCRVVGLTGSDAKVARCTAEFDYDAAVNYRASDWLEQLARACPAGVDKYFDMAGGDVTDAVMASMNPRGVHAQVGTAAVASWDPVPMAPRRERLVLVKELTQKGFVIFNHEARFAEATEALAALLRSGELRFREDVRDGLEKAPATLEALYRGENEGKALVRLVDSAGRATTGEDARFSTGSAT